MHCMMRLLFAIVLLAHGNARSSGRDVVVVRVGDGSAALSSAATAVYLERRGADGSIVGAIALPTAVQGSNRQFSLSGSSGSEGAIAVSADGRYASLAGYAADVGLASVSTTTSASVLRVVARIDGQNNVDTSTVLNAFSGANVRGAVSSDGAAFWVSGNSATASSTGVWYATLGSSSAQILASPANVRTVNIAAGQLFADSGANPFANVFAVGAGLPISAGQTATSLAGMPTSGTSMYAFLFFDRDAAVSGIDTLYVADDNAIASGGGIQKWIFDGTTWLKSNTFTNGLSVGVRGLTGEAVGRNVVLYATTAATPNNLVRLVDDGTMAPAATVIATAPTNTVYRGVTLAWRMPLTDVIFTDDFE